MPKRRPLRIMVSGCHSGPNPSPALGTARSLRAAFPQALLIGKDHAVSASGLHGDVFDDVQVARPWSDLDLEAHRAEIADFVRPAGSLYLSGLDLEGRWLAERPLAGVLLPPASALLASQKPAISGAAGMGLRVPAWVPLTLPEVELHAFCEQAGWATWIKGPAYEARRVRRWADVARARDELRSTWGEEALFAQVHVPGWEVSVAYAAFEGRLLDAVWMEKRHVTPEGKTWAGEVSPCPPALRAQLAAMLATLGWTGGGELELVRDVDGILFVIDWNPRFPAWIHGATLAGHNLPGALVEAATGRRARATPTLASQFTRVVLEVPVRPDLPLQAAPPVSLPASGGKHPSGMPVLMHLLHDRRARLPATPGPGAPPPAPPPRWTEEALEVYERHGATPQRLFLPRELGGRLEALAGALDRATRVTGLEVRGALSVKTNPDPRILDAARQRGLTAEVISEEEAVAAIAAGFPADELVRNGPVPKRGGPDVPYAFLFADSLEALGRAMRHPAAVAVGPRLRQPGVPSRFGISIADAASFERLVEQLAEGRGDLAASTHFASSTLGWERWCRTTRGMAGLAAALAGASERTLRTLDIGGGWSADGLDWLEAGRLSRLIADLKVEAPDLTRVILEPGKSLSGPAVVLATRVLEVRRLQGEDIVVDAGLGDLPLAGHLPHELVFVAAADGRATCPAGGRGRVLGRLCMEDDILAHEVAIPAWLKEGDVLLIGGCGAYDSSMAYRFGRGTHDLCEAR